MNTPGSQNTTPERRPMLLIYPLAIAAFPVLNLLAYNFAEVNWLVVLRPLTFALAGAAILLGLARLVLGDWGRAGLVTSFIIFVVVSYGHVYGALSKLTIQGIILGRHRYLVILYAILIIGGLLWIMRHARQLAAYTYLFNIMGLVLVTLPALQIANHLVKSNVLTLETRQQYQGPDAQIADLVMPETLPDIYYIILDSHTRSDALQDDFNYDNSPAMEMLREAGFYVADCSRSNYSYTLGSLTTALNMDYLNTLLAGANDTPGAEENIWVMLKQSRVRHWLEAMGYKTVAFDTTYDWSRLSDADIYLRLGSDAEILQGLTPFETMLIKSTAGLILVDSQSRLLSTQFEQINFPYSYFMSSQRFILDQLPTIPSYPGPKFVFAHIIIPHPPFIFTPDGSLMEDSRYYDGENAMPADASYIDRGYTNQVQFIDQKIVEIAQTIIAQSQVPPIIIIQGDHGWRDDNRYEILNAYYLPGISSQASSLYENISPINSFRVVFNAYFSASLPLLEDISISPKYQVVPETSPACLSP